LTKITKKLDLINSIKEQQTESKPIVTTDMKRERIYDILHARKSFEKENLTKYSHKDDLTPLRDRINSYREEKKTINTFRSEKNKQLLIGRSEE
jgi:hypothetical protein